MLAKLAYRNLAHERVKFGVGLVSVGLAITLVLVLLGIYSGAIQQAKSLPLSSGADLWIVQDGTRDMFHTVSILPPDMSNEISSIPGVNVVSAAINSPTSVTLGSKEKTVGVIAYDTTTNLLGPPEIVEGSSISATGQVVVDKALARGSGLTIGQSIELSNRPFEVVGFSGGSNAIAFQYIFTGLEEYSHANEYETSTFVNYYLVKSDMPAIALENELSSILPGTTVRTTQEVAEDNLGVIEESFLSIIQLLVFVGAAVGTMIISITVYNTTSEKIRDFAILKAIGAQPRWLRAVALLQSFVTAIGGFVIGLLGYQLVRIAAPSFIPSIEMHLSVLMVFAVGVGALVMAFIGALIPIGKINKVDPVEVFSA